MNLFYSPNILSTGVLTEQESHHAIKVLRLTTGNKLHIVDGNGYFLEGEIVEPNPKQCRINIIKTIESFEKRPYKLHMAVAPTKNIDRFEWFLEKATEIGIDEITPLICENSERKVVKFDRMERIVVAAMKQSLKAYMPKINDQVSFKEFISGTNQIKALQLIAHCYDAPKDQIKTLIDPEKHQNITILIGPEGDFSLKEVEAAEKKEFKPISLGTSRLRTETAGLVACHSVYFQYQK